MEFTGKNNDNRHFFLKPDSIQAFKSSPTKLTPYKVITKVVGFEWPKSVNAFMYIADFAVGIVIIISYY